MTRQAKRTSSGKRTSVKTISDDVPDELRPDVLCSKTIVLCLLMEAATGSDQRVGTFYIQMSDGTRSKLRLSQIAINSNTEDGVANHVRNQIMSLEEAGCRFSLSELPCYFLCWWIDSAHGGPPDYSSLHEAIDRALRRRSTDELQGRFKAYMVGVEHFGSKTDSLPSPLRAYLCSDKRCETILVKMDEFARNRKVDSAMRFLEKEASERPDTDLSEAILIVTDEIRHLRSISKIQIAESPNLTETGFSGATFRREAVKHEQSDSSHAKPEQRPKELVSLSDQKLINEANQFLETLKEQQSRKRNIPTPEESIAQVRQWFAEKKGTHFETLAGRRDFASVANDIVKSIGCGFVCPCEKVFANLRAGRVGNFPANFVMQHRVDKKMQRHLRSVDFPEVLILSDLPTLIVDAVRR